MYIHYIILGSAYEEGCRIALDIVKKDEVDENKVKKTLNYLKSRCLGFSLSTHVIPHAKKKFSDIQEYDKYFENVKLINTKEEFAKLINKDKYVNGYDVARYIMTQIPCTHLKIQKLTYLCYADYLCNTGEKLFNDRIYAYEKGPVVESVYKKLKRTKGEIKEDEDNVSEYSKKESFLPIRSRIFVTENGIDKVESINKTLAKYGAMTASDLVKLTHKSNSPWAQNIKNKEKYKRIDDQTITDYHYVEEI